MEYEELTPTATVLGISVEFPVSTSVEFGVQVWQVRVFHYHEWDFPLHWRPGPEVVPRPRGPTGTSEAEADPKTSRFSMDRILDRPLNYTINF